MPDIKIVRFSDYQKKYSIDKKEGKQREDAYLKYIKEVLLGNKAYPEYYTQKQAEDAFWAALGETLDDFAETLEESLSAPVKGEAADNSPSESTKGRKKVTRRRLEPYRGGPEFGDNDLRDELEDSPVKANPDFSLKDSTKEPVDDSTKAGVIRHTGTLVLDPQNQREFEAAEAGSVWLGFVRIGVRVGQGQEKLRLVELTEKVTSARKYAVAYSALPKGAPMHAEWLNTKFAAKDDTKTKSWNGWLPAELKRLGVPLSQTGCHYGFFLVKGEPDEQHYYNFRCPSLNRPANAWYSDFVPTIKVGKMSHEQSEAYYGLLVSLQRGGEPNVDELKARFGESGLRRAAVMMDQVSKKMPLSWAKLVVDTLQRLPKLPG